MNHLFVFSAHIDNDFIELMRIELNEAGIRTWVDHSSLKAGIGEAIRSSGAIIVIMSPDSLSSHYITYEWSLHIN